MADTWLGCCYWKTFKSVNAKVSYIPAGILRDKSAFSPVIDIFEKKTNTNE